VGAINKEGEKMESEIYEENQETYEHWFNEKRKNKAQWKLDHPVVKE
jgi:antibiotic biosynthesis monooxygenase (ABM) superfamily enzyme